MAGTMARAIHGIPVVADTTERDLLFPSPERDQRVELRSTGEIQRYDGTSWVTYPGNSYPAQRDDDTYSLSDPRYGAAGDGVTNDTAAFHAWLDDVNDNAPCIGYIPHGTFLVNAYPNSDASLPVLAAGVTILGAGYDSVLKIRAESMNASGAWRLWYYQSDTAFRNFRLHGNRDGILTANPTLTNANIIAFARYADGLSNLEFADLWIHDLISRPNGGTALESFGIALGAGCSDIRIRRITGWRNQGTPVHINGKIETSGDPFGGTNLCSKVAVSDIVTHDNEWAGLSVYGAEDVHIANIHSYDNDQGGINFEWCRNVDVFNPVSHTNGYAGVTAYGRASVRLHNPTLYNNGTATGTHAEIRLLPYSWYEGAPAPYGNIGTFEVRGGSITPVAGGRHLFYRADQSVNTGQSVPDAIILDVPGAESWTITTDAGSDRPCPTLQLPAVQTTRPVQVGKLSALTLAGGISTADYAGAGNLSSGAQTLTATAQFANAVTGYVLKPGRKYLVRSRVKIHDTVEWRLTHEDSGATKPQTVILPYDTQDVDQWFSVQSVFTPSTNETRVLFIANGTVATDTDLTVDYLEVHEIVGGTAASELQPFGKTYQGRGTAAPAGGTWGQGDMIWNDTPGTNGNLGWVCTVGGTPGTWREFGLVQSDTASPSFTGVTAETVAATTSISGPTVAATTSATIGSSGTALTQVRVYSPTLTPGSIPANTTANQTFTVTGLTTSDIVYLNPPDLANACAPIAWRVSAADTLKVYFNNPTAGALTPSSGTYKIVAVRS